MDRRLYDYELDPKFIAKRPANPRDSSKLFIYKTETDEIIFDKFLNIDKYLPQNSFLVMNETKVLPARTFWKKENGDEVELLILINEIQPSDKFIKAICSKKLRPGETIYLGKNILKAINTDQKIFVFKANFHIKDLAKILMHYGKTPIPKYIQNSNLSETELRRKYQTTFAKNDGSIAAPTASLHFTKRVFEKLRAKKISELFVTLHVGLGTFAPLEAQNILEKKLYDEYYFIKKETIKKLEKLKKSGHKLVAVGTTTTRTLESFAKNGEPNGSTNIFILPPYNFKLVDHLITNFHVPKSSLMMLVEAFLDHKKAKRNLVDLYKIAMKNNFKFYSFGDSMLIL